MNIYVYSDESGVFDNKHNDLYAFGGLIFLSKASKDGYSRKYSAIEKEIRINGKYEKTQEIKASVLKNSEKRRLFNCLKNAHKFGVVIFQKRLLDRIFLEKKHKQRYLDYAFKIGVKSAFENLIKKNLINPDEVENIFFFVDEHTTATDGIYELREALLNEFKYGTYNAKWDKFYEPIFPRMKNVDVRYCNSRMIKLVRAADIVANKLWNDTKVNPGQLCNIDNLSVKFLPS